MTWKIVKQGFYNKILLFGPALECRWLQDRNVRIICNKRYL